MRVCVELKSFEMKIFQEIQRSFLILGITPYQSIQANPFNTHIVKALLGSVLSTASYFLWFFYIAMSFNEYVKAIFYIFGSAITTVGFSVLVWKMKQWFRFIDNLETFINESKLNGK